MPVEVTQELIEDLRNIIEQGDDQRARAIMNDLHPVEIAGVYEELNIEQARYLYLLLDGEKAADTLMELDEDDRERFLKVIPSEVIAKQFIDNMDSDDAADVIGGMSAEQKEEVLQYVRDVEQAGDIVDLLAYDEDTAGGLMAKELIKVYENWNVVTSLREMRKQVKDVDEVYYVYVVDDSNILKGILSLKKLLTANTNAKIKNIYDADVISVRTDTHKEEVANIMNKYDLVALPVTDSIGRLMGRITIDDVVDVIVEEAERDYQMISGITEDVEPTDRVWLLTRARLPWLMIGLLGGILVAQVISLYESDLKVYPEMAIFFPLIAAMAGNVGVQSSSIIVQGLASKTYRIERSFRNLLKEFVVALINGFILSGIIFAYNIIVAQPLALTVTVSLSLFSVILFASIFGTIIPLLLNRFRIDPALATGPFITTMNDIIGLLIYLMMGRLLYTLI